jgi:hypothetical protein
MSSQFDSSMLKLPVDMEHNGIRAVGCLLLFGVSAIVMVIVSLLVRDSLIVAIVAGLGTGSFVSWYTDKRLRGKWLSGRELLLSSDLVALTQKDKVEYSLDPRKQINPLFWYFTAKRSGRIKKGWHVVGFAVEQDDEFVPFYTFVPPDGLDKLSYGRHFVQLQKLDEKDLKGSGLQRRLLAAESHRNAYGAEMTNEHFEQALTYLSDHFSGWMPKA